MQPALLVIIAEEQRAEAVPCAARLGEADHHELVAFVAFHLAPIAAAAGPVGPVAALGDRAFEPIAAGMAEEIRAVPLLMVAVAHHTGSLARHDLGERFLAVLGRGAGAVV